MKAYYIHWNYPPSADTILYDYGKDDEHFFYHRDNAEEFAKNTLAKISENIKRAECLLDKHYDCTLTDDEEKEFDKLFGYLYNDSPDSYSIRKRDIVFEDE